MLKAFESLMSLLEAAANKVVHDTRHFYGLSLFVVSRMNEDSTPFYGNGIKVEGMNRSWIEGDYVEFCKMRRSRQTSLGSYVATC